MQPVALIYLVWSGAGISSFQRFVDSYRRFRPGCDHTLVLVFKEVKPSERSLYQALVSNIDHLVIDLPLPCLDLPAYLQVARRISAERLCLLNSSSELLADDWLAMLDVVAAEPWVGAAAATGSWESHVTTTFDSWRHAAVRGEPPDPLRMRQESESLIQLFSPFPNFHLRTNALMIRRDLLVGLPFDWKTGSRLECLAFESGWQGLTHQMLRLGLAPLVVGRDGNVYEKERWPQSNTFRMGLQENLLVGDNRTRDFAEADLAGRRDLTVLAWGPR